jgi:hypothetical protein
MIGEYRGSSGSVGVSGIMINPNSWSNTVSFFSLITQSEIARFKISPDTYISTVSPSRTCFDQDDNIWIANRGINTVVKIGIYNHRTDMEQNTSSSATDVKAWGSDSRVLREYHLSHDGLTESRIPGAIYQGAPLSNSQSTSNSSVQWYISSIPAGPVTATNTHDHMITLYCFGHGIRYNIAVGATVDITAGCNIGGGNTFELGSLGYDTTASITINYFAASTGNVYSGTVMGLRGMACDKDGNIWVGSYYNKNGVAQMVAWKIDRVTDVITQFVPAINGQAYGALYNPVSDRVFFTPTTDVNTAFIECNPNTNVFTARGTSNGYAYGLTIDSLGNMYRPRPSYSNVYKYNSSGGYVGSVAIGHGGHSCCVARLNNNGVYTEYLYIINAGTRNITCVRCNDLVIMQNTLLPSTYSAYHGISADPYNENIIWAEPYASSANTVCRIVVNPLNGNIVGTPTFIACGTTGHYCYSDFTGYYSIFSEDI